MEKNVLKIKSNMVVMPKGVFVLMLALAFMFGDSEAVGRVNSKTFEKLKAKIKEMAKEGEDAETGDDEI